MVKIDLTEYPERFLTPTIDNFRARFFPPFDLPVELCSALPNMIHNIMKGFSRLKLIAPEHDGSIVMLNNLTSEGIKMDLFIVQRFQDNFRYSFGIRLGFNLADLPRHGSSPSSSHN
jgi:hypothetical protein